MWDTSNLPCDALKTGRFWELLIHSKVDAHNKGGGSTLQVSQATPPSANGRRISSDHMYEHKWISYHCPGRVPALLSKLSCKYGRSLHFVLEILNHYKSHTGDPMQQLQLQLPWKWQACRSLELAL